MLLNRTETQESILVKRGERDLHAKWAEAAMWGMHLNIGRIQRISMLHCKLAFTVELSVVALLTSREKGEETPEVMSSELIPSNL